MTSTLQLLRLLKNSGHSPKLRQGRPNQAPCIARNHQPALTEECDQSVIRIHASSLARDYRPSHLVRSGAEQKTIRERPENDKYLPEVVHRASILSSKVYVS